MADWPVKQTHHIPPYFALFYLPEYWIKSIEKYGNNLCRMLDAGIDAVPRQITLFYSFWQADMRVIMFNLFISA